MVWISVTFYSSQVPFWLSKTDLDLDISFYFPSHKGGMLVAAFGFDVVLDSSSSRIPPLFCH